VRQVADFASDEQVAVAARRVLAHIGPAVLFPLGVPGRVRGVFTVGRRRGALPFSQAVTDVVASFAAQAGAALELAERRRGAEQVALYEERDRIARDLHDHVIQRLYATGMSLQGAVPVLARPEAPSRIQNAVDAMDETIRDIRTTIFTLQSHSKDTGPSLRRRIVAVIDEMTPMLRFPPTVQLSAHLDDHTAGEPAEQMLAALREALFNAARHARASQVDVSVQADSHLTLQVTDNGVGIPPGASRSSLTSLAKRAALLGGTLRTGPADQAGGTGTMLVWQVPIR
jgi:signal transduction histidine kinase